MEASSFMRISWQKLWARHKSISKPKGILNCSFFSQSKHQALSDNLGREEKARSLHTLIACKCTNPINMRKMGIVSVAEAACVPNKWGVNDACLDSSGCFSAVDVDDIPAHSLHKFQVGHATYIYAAINSGISYTEQTYFSICEFSSDHFNEFLVPRHSSADLEFSGNEFGLIKNDYISVIFQAVLVY